MTAVGVQVETETNSHGAGAHPDGARAPGAGATERFAQRVLGDAWLPALDGVTSKLARGATVADVGCGHGISTTGTVRRR